MKLLSLLAFALATGAVLGAADEKPKANPLHLTAAQRSAAGITLAPVRKESLTPQTEAFGRVLDPTAYVSLVAEVATARAALTASERERDRARQLFAAGGNTSAQNVETAEAAAARDRAAFASAQLRLTAAWGQKLGERADVDELKAMLAEGMALIRIDLPPGSPPPATGAAAKVELLGAGGGTYPAEIFGPAPVADPQVLGASLLAIVKRHSLPAGAVLRVTLAAGTAPVDALVVPAGAVVYQQGSAWVFELGKNDTFARKLVAVGAGAPDGGLVVDGVDADDQVAVTGAQQLLSTELQAAAGGGED